MKQEVSLSVIGEADARVRANQALVKVDITVEKPEEKAAQDAAFTLAESLEGLIHELWIPKKEDDRVIEAANKTKDGTSSRTDNPPDDDDYEVVTDSERRASESKTSRYTSVLRQTAENGLPDDSALLSQLHARAIKDYSATPLTVSLAGLEQCPFERLFGKPKGRTGNAGKGGKDADTHGKGREPYWQGSTSFWITFHNVDVLESFVASVKKLGDGCSVSDIAYSLRPKTAQKTMSTLRRAAMKDALAQVRDYCYGLACKPSRTTILPTKIEVIEPSPWRDGTISYPTPDDNFGLAFSGVYTSPPELVPKFHAKVTFDIEMDTIYLDDKYDPKKIRASQNDPFSELIAEGARDV